MRIDSFDFKGTEAGPSIVITAGIHGNEQTGTYVANEIIAHLATRNILGNIRIIPVCNESAFKARDRTATQDNEDMNRSFPGNIEGSYTEQLAAALWEETKEYDYIIDLHCCGIYGHFYTMCAYSEFEDQKELSCKLAIDTVIHTAGTAGQFYLEARKRRKQHALLIEFPGGQPAAIIDLESGTEGIEKIMNYLCLLGIVEGEGKHYPTPKFAGVIVDGGIITDRDGKYTQQVRAGEYIQKNQLLCMVNDKAFFSPIDAIVTASPVDRYVFAGDKLISLAPSQEIATI